MREVYRLIFLFVAEDRELLHPPGSEDAARVRFARFFSTARLRRLATRRSGTRHPDLWLSYRQVVGALSSEAGLPELWLPALGGFLFSSQATPHLDASAIANRDLLEAIRALSTTAGEGGRLVAVDWRNLGSEELGSVYEALLELHPIVNLEVPSFELSTAAGHERKTTGSYYTPTSLINCLLDSALDPVIAEAAAKPEPEQALLAFKVCDPACGSGHFLIAAAHRIAKRLAAARSGEEEPSPEAVRKALRDVIGHCIYGVDINPMAVELCKVNLWLESLEPGKPLSFLDHHIQVGNSLLGATPRSWRREFRTRRSRRSRATTRKSSRGSRRSTSRSGGTGNEARDSSTSSLGSGSATSQRSLADLGADAGCDGRGGAGKGATVRGARGFCRLRYGPLPSRRLVRRVHVAQSRRARGTPSRLPNQYSALLSRTLNSNPRGESAKRSSSSLRTTASSTGISLSPVSSKCHTVESPLQVPKPDGQGGSTWSLETLLGTP